VEFVEGDIRDVALLSRSLKDAEGVFHLAAQVGNLRSMDEPLRDMAVNAGGTIAVLESMRSGHVRRLVYSSSAACLGEVSSLPVTESAPCEPTSPYGVSKLAGEKYALAYRRLFNWDVAALRYFNVYGVRQRFDAYGNVIPIFAQRLRDGLPLTVYGDGHQTRDFVNVTDVARANVDAYERRVSGVFNVATGNPTEIGDLARLMTNKAGAATIPQHRPARPEEVLRSFASIGCAREAFGFEPRVDLNSGIGDYMTWFAADQDER
jgi:UDP-glucose 4-epimerase